MKMNINNIKENKVVVKTSSINEIKIPMIQRDYVQGLDDKKLVPFLNALINTLSHQSKTQQIETLSLDFIYGNINEDGVFEPIDGQQRLTTLALLTFYLYCRQKNSNNKIKNPFTYITYATRQSAKKFCELLAEYEYTDKFGNNKPSNVIKKNPKYFREYDEDTTISAMLKTLDKIHEIINDKKPNINNNTGQDDIQSFINTLASNIDKINFQIFPMESFNLSDDLYIKMNGRGKQLSSFDNFKADYFKWLEEKTDNNDNNIDKLIPNSIVSDEDNNKYKEEGKEKERKKHKLETLKRKFDTDYIDIFWDYALKNSEDTDETPDPEKLFFRFINRFVVGKYLLLTDTQKNNIKNDFEKTFFDDGIKSEKDAVVFNNIELYKSILNEQDNDKKYTYNYKIINILENLSNLQKYCSNNFKDILNFIFNPLWEDEELNIFPKKDWLTYKHILVFNAITSFLEQDSIIDNYKCDKCDKCNKLKERVIDNKTFLINEECNIYNILITLKRISRIVWNITEQYNLLNTISKDNYKTVMSRLDFSKLGKLENVYYKFQNICGGIDNEKQNNKNSNEYNINKIIEDEVKKCQYILDEPELEQKFIKLEKLPYLKGTIGFLLPVYKTNEIDEAKDVFFNSSNRCDDDCIKLLEKIEKSSDKCYTDFRIMLINQIYNSDDNKLLYNKLLNSASIRNLIISNDNVGIYAKKTFIDIINNQDAKTYEQFLDNESNTIYAHFFLYHIAALLYLKKDNDDVYNNYYVDNKKYSYLMPKNRLEKSRYTNKAGRLTIIFEPEICGLIAHMFDLEIKFENNIPEKILYQGTNEKEYFGFSNVIPESNGNIVIYFKIHDVPYTLWFIHNSFNPEIKEEIGITDEIIQPKKQLFRQCDNYNEFKNYIAKLKSIINKLVDDKELTLNDIYNIPDLSDGFNKLNSE